MGDKILVIDDDETARSVVEAVLAKAGFRTHGLSSPIGATRAVREHGIDAVVCDLNMPAMRGDALARLFRESKSLHAVPLILISGAPPTDLEELVAEGMVDSIVHKSELSTRLVEQLRRLLSQR